MKPSEVYTRAAELIASGEHTSLSMAIMAAGKSSRHLSSFILYFSEHGFVPLPRLWSHERLENQRVRELALYLMAEIAKELE